MSLDRRRPWWPSHHTPTVLLAAIEGQREHVQIGNVMDHDAAYVLWELLDGDLGTIHGRGKRPHYIHGEPVKFYRLRGPNPEDIDITNTVPVGHIRRGKERTANA